MTITDEDEPPSVSIDDVSRAESNTTAPFTLTLSGASEKQISLKVSTVAGSAVGGATCSGGIDYVSLSNLNVVFSPLVLTRTVNVSICDDVFDEFAENAALVLTLPVNVTLGDATGVLAIQASD